MTVVAALSAKQTGAKQITLTLGKAVSEAPAVTVKKGAVTLSLATKDGVTLSSDGKTIVLTTNAPITADKYTITIGDNITELTGEASKVVSIEVTGEELVLAASAANPMVSNDTATAAYVVKNQFGEDVSKNATIASGDAKITATSGTVTYKAAGGEKVGDAVAVVLYDTTTGVSTSKVLKLSNKSVISSLTLKGIYNKDGKTLSEDTNLTNDAFYILLEAKDQYGKAVTATGSYTDVVVNLVPGLTGTTLAGAFTKVTVDGTDYLGIRINGTPAVGTASTIIIAKSNGQSVTATYSVADGVKVDTFDFSVPEMVVAGEKVNFEFSATDTYGNAVTDVAKLNAMTGTHTNFSFEKGKDGKAVLVYDVTAKSSQTTDTIESAMFITKTNKVVTKTFTLKAAATPKAITNVKDVAISALNATDNKITIKPENIVVEDQYGREMKAADVKKAIDATTTAEAAAQLFTISGASTGASNNTNLEFTVKAGKDAGTETITLKLNGVADSDYTVTLSTVDQKTIKSYELADIATVYTNGTDATSGDYLRAVTVNGILADGSKVVVPATEYNVITSANITYSAGKIGAVANLKNTGKALEKVDEATEKVTVVINATAEELTKDVKISKAAPAVASAKLDGVDEITLTAGDEVSIAKLVANGKIKVTDQYGVESAFAADTNRLSITEVSDTTNVTVTNNGLSSATTAMSATGNYTATAKITFASGYTFTFKVNFSKAS